MSDKLREGMLLGMGNPLLDMSVNADDNLLSKYNLKANDAILASEKHAPLYEELKNDPKIEYIAGGSTQNSLRVAQWILGKAKVSVYIGCVGEDEYSNILESKARQDGVDVKYQYTKEKQTGTCAVLLTKNGCNRSLVANLAAAECFTKDHLEHQEVMNLINNAEVYYSSSFFLTVSLETILEIAQISLKRDKIFMLNLSAPFLTKLFKERMMQVMPYVDILFGNETEALSFAQEQNFGTEDLREIAVKLCNLPKQNPSKERMIVLTQGTLPVLLYKDGVIKEFEVAKIPDERIIDTNGAGDAFVGGFMAQLVKGESTERCIECGIWAAGCIVQMPGCTFSGPPTFQPVS